MLHLFHHTSRFYCISQLSSSMQFIVHRPQSVKFLFSSAWIDIRVGVWSLMNAWKTACMRFSEKPLRRKIPLYFIGEQYPCIITSSSSVTYCHTTPVANMMVQSNGVTFMVLLKKNYVHKFQCVICDQVLSYCCFFYGCNLWDPVPLSLKLFVLLQTKFCIVFIFSIAIIAFLTTLCCW